MTTIKLGALVKVTRVNSRGRRPGISKGYTGVITDTELVMTNEGERTYYKVYMAFTKKTITLAETQFEVLGHPETDPEMFI